MHSRKQDKWQFWLLIVLGLAICIQNRTPSYEQQPYLSDRSIKSNIRFVQYAPSVIDSLSPIEYEWMDKSRRDSTRHIGFAAQDVEQIAPGAVFPAGGNLKAVDPNSIAALLVLEVQELRKRIDALEKN